MKPNPFNMKKFLRIVFGLTVLASGLMLFSGCEEKNQYDSSIPWSRPADWENQMPGMGGG